MSQTPPVSSRRIVAETSLIHPPSSGYYIYLTGIILCLAIAEASYFGWHYEIYAKSSGDAVSALRSGVLAGRASMPYQHHRYLFDRVSKWLETTCKINVKRTYSTIYALGFACLLGSEWYLLASVRKASLQSLLLAFFFTAWAGMQLIAASWDHPADPYGAALFALSLGFAVRNHDVALLLTAAVSGFIWQKHILLSPLLFLYCLTQDQKKRAVFLSVAVLLLANIGPFVYGQIFGPSKPNTPGIAPSFAMWCRTIPEAGLGHALLVFLPFSLLYFRFSSVPVVLRVAVILYPMMLAVYMYLWYPWGELRSFWNCVPVFASIIGSALFTSDWDSPIASDSALAREV